MLQHGPLSDDEIDELERFLLDAEGIDESMDVSTLDGFLTAIVCGPITVLPSQWLPWVWDQERGRDSPAWVDVAQATRIYTLLLRHMNDIAQRLREAPADFEPLIMQNVAGPEPVSVIDEWCWGFMKGVGLNREAWQPTVDLHPDWFETLSLYGTLEGFDRLEQLGLSLAEHQRRADGLASVVRRIHDHFFTERSRNMRAAETGSQRREPIRNETKIGRNLPCPCGSGRKFKHCHGRAN
jgi:uncharacterized protein